METLNKLDFFKQRLAYFANIDRLDIEQIITESKKTDTEICGFWDSESRIYPEHNFSDEPKTSFTFLPSIFAEIKASQQGLNAKTFAGIFHSHPSDDMAGILSPCDLELSRKLDLDICVYHPKFEIWDYYSPIIPHPFPLAYFKYRQGQIENIDLDWFLNWSYCPYRADCFTIVYYFYQLVLDIEIPNPPRFDTDYDKPNHWNRFIDEAEYYGFKEINPYKDGVLMGDLAIMDISTKSRSKPNHAGILVPHNGEYFLLHLLSDKKPSACEKFSKFRPYTCKYYRHTEIIERGLVYDQE
jgi:proteasome lid subunit RPN8/RPN11